MADWSVDMRNGSLVSCLLSLVSIVVFAQVSPPQNFTLTLNKAGAGAGIVTSFPDGINCGPDCATAKAVYAMGTPVVLTATPETGSAFVGWSGFGCVGSGSCAVTMVSNITITATFGIPPQINNITPVKGSNDRSVDVTIDGDNFSDSGMTAKLTKIGQPDINGTDIITLSARRIVAKFDLTNKETGIRQLSVLNSKDGLKAIYNSFTVESPSDESTQDKKEIIFGPPPIVTAISPNAAFNDPSFNKEPVERVIIKGFHFDEDGFPRLVKGEDYLAPNEAVAIDSRTIIAVFDLTGAPDGEWDVLVYNSDGQFATLGMAYKIVKSPSAGKPDLNKRLPQSGMEYLVDYLYGFLGREASEDEEATGEVV